MANLLLDLRVSTRIALRSWRYRWLTNSYWMPATSVMLRGLPVSVVTVQVSPTLCAVAAVQSGFRIVGGVVS